MLEAAMVRCLQDRNSTRYDAECVNARQAARKIEARKEAARRAELEERSESKRLALRRAQEAAMQAREQAAEARRLEEEEEWLAMFGEPEDGDREEADALLLTDAEVPLNGVGHAPVLGTPAAANSAAQGDGSNELPQSGEQEAD